jgi:hypothetical protein
MVEYPIARLYADARFNKLNFDIARIQLVSSGWSVYGRLSAQWATDNLDSSEKFILGGPYGVRAWPNGEAPGDQGWLAQLELRYRWGPVEPFVFYDGWRIRVNHEPFAVGGQQPRHRWRRAGPALDAGGLVRGCLGGLACRQRALDLRSQCRPLAGLGQCRISLLSPTRAG